MRTCTEKRLNPHSSLTGLFPTALLLACRHARQQAPKSCGALTLGDHLPLTANNNNSEANSIIVATALDVDHAKCRAEAPTLRMSSGQLSIAFPVRKGIPPAIVKHEIRKQMKSLSEAREGLYTEVGLEARPYEQAFMMSLQRF